MRERNIHPSRAVTGVITSLVAFDHLPTTDELEFVGMVESGEDLIFDTLCSNSESDHVSPTSSEGRRPNDGESKAHMTLATPAQMEGAGVIGSTREMR
jgi:hypothetical protein